jgi:hypothetical protein
MLVLHYVEVKGFILIDFTIVIIMIGSNKEQKTIIAGDTRF